MRRTRIVAISAVGLLAAGAAACGQGRQDANEPAGNFKVAIVDASFPAKQFLADEPRMKIKVRNEADKDLPNVAVTVATDPGSGGGAPQAFAQDIANPEVADASRPVWVLDKGPGGGNTAYTNTWALGELKAGETREFKWRLTAVRPGDYTINYSVSPGLTGKAKPASGPKTKGTFKVDVSAAPPDARVSPSGKIIRKPGKGIGSGGKQ